VAKTPYRLIYRVETGRIFIVRVIHGAMRWPPEEE
jgi:plasmid stabilization system protein ParE